MKISLIVIGFMLIALRVWGAESNLSQTNDLLEMLKNYWWVFVLFSVGTYFLKSFLDKHQEPPPMVSTKEEKK